MINGEIETNENTIRPGDVYKYRCGNDQGYGYMIPVKTSKGWDFIDTYQLGVPWRKKEGETGVDASIRQIIELGCDEHDGYVSRVTSSFYYHNVHYMNDKIPYGLRLLFNLNDYEAASEHECNDYDDDDVIKFVPLYFEQNYNWRFGKTLGLCFIRKNAEKSPINEFKNLLSEVSDSITEPSVWYAANRLDEVKKKLSELNDLGLSTQENEDVVSRLAKRIEIINKCVEDLKKNRQKAHVAAIVIRTTQERRNDKNGNR